MAATVMVEGWRWGGSGTVGAEEAVEAVEAVGEGEAAAAEGEDKRKVGPTITKGKAFCCSVFIFSPLWWPDPRAKSIFLILRRQFPGIIRNRAEKL